MTEWVIRDGKLFHVFAPVREGKKEVLGTAKVTLSPDHAVIIAKAGHNSIRLPVVETTPPREETEDVLYVIYTYRRFGIELDGERATFEFMVGWRYTPDHLNRVAEQRKATDARWAEHAAELNREAEAAFQILRSTVSDADLIHDAARKIKFSHHNKLWGDQRTRYVRNLLADRVRTTCTEHYRINQDDLSDAEIEQVRLQIWRVCEELRAAKKKEWLAAHAA